MALSQIENCCNSDSRQECGAVGSGHLAQVLSLRYLHVRDSESLRQGLQASGNG